jgi:hypothetical protein
MTKPWLTRRGSNGENWCDRVRVLGRRGTPYLRYDHSHHLEKEPHQVKLTQSLRVPLLAIWPTATNVLRVFTLTLPGISIVLAILATAAGVFILVNR